MKNRLTITLFLLLSFGACCQTNLRVPADVKIKAKKSLFSYSPKKTGLMGDGIWIDVFSVNKADLSKVIPYLKKDTHWVYGSISKIPRKDAYAFSLRSMEVYKIKEKFDKEIADKYLSNSETCYSRIAFREHSGRSSFSDVIIHLVLPQYGIVCIIKVFT